MRSRNGTLVTLDVDNTIACMLYSFFDLISAVDRI